MALYPTLTETPYITLGQSNDYKTLKSNFDDLGKPQVKRKWLYPRRSVVLEYSNILNTEFNTLEQFYMARYGGYAAFTFIMPSTEAVSYVGEYISTGDGSTTVYNLPMKAASLISIYLDGNLQTITTNYTISAGGGQDGVDAITFIIAPNAGERITCDFTGSLCLRCRFGDQLTHSRNRAGTITTNNLSVQLSGLLIDE